MKKNLRSSLRKIQAWYIDRIINKWDKNVITCEDAKEQSVDKLLKLFKKYALECVPKRVKQKNPLKIIDVVFGYNEALEEIRENIEKLSKI